MNKGILILAHGSREKSTEKTLAWIVSALKKKLGAIPLETAYLQFCDVNLEKGLDRLVEQGAVDIKVIPYFLFDGVHIKEDIPEEIRAYLKKKSGIRITFGETLGADTRLADILLDRVNKLL